MSPGVRKGNDDPEKEMRLMAQTAMTTLATNGEAPQSASNIYGQLRYEGRGASYV